MSVDPASLEFHFADYSTVKATPPKEILDTARFDKPYYAERFGGGWDVEPGKMRVDGLAFFPAGTDLTQARAVTMTVNGARVIVPGHFHSAASKAVVLEGLQLAP